MSWQENVFKNFRLYAVTDVSASKARTVLRRVEAAYRNGADIVQLRSKTLSLAERLRLGIAIKKTADRLKKLYFVNDSLDLALLTQAHGLHVGQDDLPPKMIRKLCHRLKKKIFLGLSTHSETQARSAQKEPIDYFAVGPVFATPTKPHYGAVGLHLVERVASFAKKPWVAIGGIDEENIRQVLRRGARRVAVVRAIFSAPNSGLASRRLTRIIQGD